MASGIITRSGIVPSKFTSLRSSSKPRVPASRRVVIAPIALKQQFRFYTTAPPSSTTTRTRQPTTSTTTATKKSSAAADTSTQVSEQTEVEVHEKGHIYFFYRPKVEHSEANSVDDVQRLEIILSAGTVQNKGRKKQSNKVYRLMVLPRKVMPDINKHSRYMALIYDVSNNVEDLHKALEKEQYETKTRGERTIEGARPIGEGVYSIIQHGRHTHLLYALELPKKLGEVQQAFNLEKEGSYIISVKNPQLPPTPDSRISKASSAPNIPKELLNVFEDRKWNPAVPVDLLNYGGTWVLLLGAADDLKKEFGSDSPAVKTIQELEESDLKEMQTSRRAVKPLAEKLFAELRIDSKEHPVDPLIRGKWT